MKLWTVRVGEKDGLPWNDVVITDLRQPMLRSKEVDKIRREGGWHLYRVGRAKLSESGMAALPTLPNRNVRFFLGAFYDPKDPNRKFDIYLSFKDGGDNKSLLIDSHTCTQCALPFLLLQSRWSLSQPWRPYQPRSCGSL